ncbi:MAG TPA: hypothetical protein VL688_12225 [Verrucomicrobiae bacterium]|jgi:hypothetical protein|nr:hypothetical protein [Verrucomicrobiae bacterium]
MKKLSFVLLVGFFPLASTAGAAEPLLTSAPVFDSAPAALQHFQSRPPSELSKLIYLIDLLEKTPVEIVYDGRYYKAGLVSPFIRFHLSRNYKKETAEAWISKWCYRSAHGEKVYVKLPDGELRPARDILMGELERLDSLCGSGS